MPPNAELPCGLKLSDRRVGVGALCSCPKIYPEKTETFSGKPSGPKDTVWLVSPGGRSTTRISSRRLNAARAPIFVHCVGGPCDPVPNATCSSASPKAVPHYGLLQNRVISAAS